MAEYPEHKEPGRMFQRNNLRALFSGVARQTGQGVCFGRFTFNRDRTIIGNSGTVTHEAGKSCILIAAVAASIALILLEKFVMSGVNHTIYLYTQVICCQGQLFSLPLRRFIGNQSDETKR